MRKKVASLIQDYLDLRTKRGKKKKTTQNILFQQNGERIFEEWNRIVSGQAKKKRKKKIGAL